MRIPAIISLLLAGHQALAFTITLTPRHETCGNANGAIDVYIDGPAMAPLTYDWSNGATTPSLTGIQAGTYSVTVVDFFGESATAQVDVLNLSALTSIGGGQWSYGVEEVTGYQGPACPGQCNGSRFMYFQDGTAPYTIEWADPGISFLANYIGQPIFTGFCNGSSYSYTVVDALGCPGSGSFTEDLIDGANPPFITAIEGACGGGANGAVEVNVSFTWYGQSVSSLWQNGTDITTLVTYDYLGDWVIRLSDLAAGDYEYRQMAGTAGLPSICYEIIPFTIEDLGNSCGNVSGTLYIDHAQDCVQDIGDPGVPFKVLEIQPGPEYAITNEDGTFSRNLPLGAYDLAPLGTDLYSLCPPNSPTPFELTGADPLVTLEIADSSLIDLDLQTWLSAGVARPGFVHTIQGQVRDLSGQQSAPVDLTFTFDPVLSFIAALPVPTSVVGNVVTWSGLDPLSAFGMFGVQVDLQVPPDAGLIGTAITHTLEVQQAFTETSVANNTATWNDVISGSYDPNNKIARTSSGVDDGIYFIDADEWVDYTIRFQNTGTDTAFILIITDTLDGTLDMATFEQGAASHPFDIRFKPGRVVEWRFENILLPDSGANEPASHGLVTFRIKPVQPLSGGTLIENTANIFFDYNEPVITAPSVLVAGFSTGVGRSTNPSQQLEVMPNPASDHLFVRCVTGSMSEVTLIATDGQVVLTNTPNAGSLAVDLGSLAPGIYGVRVRLHDGSLMERSIVKQ